GSRVRLTRDIGTVTMDLNGVEHLQLDALGGADNITVNDLSGTGVTQVAIDLASPPGSGMGDLAADSVTVNATKGDDVIEVQGQGGSLTVAGLSELVTISGSEATDALTVAGGNGNDTLSAATMLANTAHPRRRRRERHHHRKSGRRSIARRRRQRRCDRRPRQRYGLARQRQRHVHLESGRWQRHGRGPGRHGYARVQWRQHQ